MQIRCLPKVVLTVYYFLRLRRQSHRVRTICLEQFDRRNRILSRTLDSQVITFILFCLLNFERRTLSLKGLKPMIPFRRSL